MKNMETQNTARKISMQGMIRIITLAVLIVLSLVYFIFGEPLLPKRFAVAEYGVFLFLLMGLGMLLANFFYFAWQILLAIGLVLHGRFFLPCNTSPIARRKIRVTCPHVP